MAKILRARTYDKFSLTTKNVRPPRRPDVLRTRLDSTRLDSDVTCDLQIINIPVHIRIFRAAAGAGRAAAGSQAT